MNENAAYMQSYEARINLVKTAWQEFSLAMGNAVVGDTIIVLTNLLKTFANIFTSVVNEVGVFPPLLGTLGLTLGTLSKSFRTTTISVLTLGKGLKAMGVSANVAKASLRSLLASTGVGIAFVAIGFALEGLINLFGSTNEAQSDFFDELQTNVSETKSQISDLNNTTEKIKSGSTSQEELVSIYEQLSDTIPSVISHYDKEGNIIYKNREQVLALVEAEKELLALKLRAQNTEMFASMDEQIQSIDGSRKRKEELSNSRNTNLASEEAYKLIKSFGDETQVFDAFIWDYDDKIKDLKSQIKNIFEARNLGGSDAEKYILSNLRSFYDGIDNTIEYSKKSRAELDAELANLDVSITNGIRSYTNLLKGFGESQYIENDFSDNNVRVLFDSIAQSLVDSTEVTPENYAQIKDNYQLYLDQITELIKTNKIDVTSMFEAADFSPLYQALPELEGKLASFASNSSKYLNGATGSFTVYDEAGRKLGEYSSQLEATDKGIKIFADSMKIAENGVVSFTGVQEDLNSSLLQNSEHIKQVKDELKNTFNATSSEIKSLNNIINDLNNGQSLSTEVITDLILKYPQLASEVSKTSDGYKISTTTLDLLRQANIKHASDSIESQIKTTISTLENTLNRVTAYGLEIDAINDINSAMNQTKKLGFISFFGEDAFENIKFDDSNFQIKNGNSVTTWSEEQYNNIKESFNQQQSAYNLLIQLGNLQESKNVLLKMLNDPSYGLLNNSSVNKTPYSQSSSSYTPKDSPKIQDTTDAQINKLNELSEIQAKNNQSLKDSIDTEETLAIQIKKNTQLYSDQILELNLLNSAILNLRAERTKFIESTKYDKHTMASWIDANGETTEAYWEKFNKLETGAAQEELQKIYDKYYKYTMAIRENRESVAELQQENKKLLKTLQSLREENTRNWIEKKTEAYQKYQDAITASERKQMRYYEEGSSGWLDEQQKQIEAYKQWQEALNKDNETYRARIKQNESARKEDKLTEQQLKDLEAQIKANSDAWWQYEQSIISLNKSMQDQREKAADKIIDSFKKMLQKQKELELKAIDERINAEDKRHKEVMSNYDKELNATKENINARLEALNRQNDTEDYERELTRLLDEQSEIQNKINIIANDDSYDAKAKRKELHEQLADVQERIEDKQRERSRYEQRQVLEDQLSDHEKYIGNLKDLEDQNHNKIKENLDIEKELREIYWNSILENEQYFSQLKQNLLSGDIAAVEAALSTIRMKYDTFFAYLQTQASSLGDIFKTINDNFKLDYENIKMPSSPSTNIGGNSSGNTNNSNNNQTSTGAGHSIAALSAWKEYLSNKQKAEALGNNKGAEFNRLKARNDELRAKYNFKDGSYAELSKSSSPVFSAETGGMTTAWGKQGKFAVLHEKELVLNKADTSNILKVVDVVRTITNSIKQFDLSKMFNFQNSNTATGVGTTINHLSIEINGSKINDGYSAADQIVESLYRKGISL